MPEFLIYVKKRAPRATGELSAFCRVKLMIIYQKDTVFIKKTTNRFQRLSFFFSPTQFLSAKLKTSMEIPELFFRGREDEKRAREFRRDLRKREKGRDFDHDEYSSQRSARIRFSDEAFEHVAKPREFFRDREDLVLDRLFLEIQGTDFDVVRFQFFDREKLEDLLRELSRDFRILSFLGAGFNRAVFLVEDYDGKRFAAKVPIRRRGFKDNSNEARIYNWAVENGDRWLFARTSIGSSGIAIQEVCRPIKLENLTDGEFSLMFDLERDYAISDLQFGKSLEDGRTKVLDFGLTISAE